MTKPVIVGLNLHGIVWDLAPEDVASDRWTDGLNVFFMNGETHRCEGINKVFEAGQLFDAEAVWYVDMGQREWWIYCSGEGVGVTDGEGNHYDITPLGWGPIVFKNYIWSIGDLNSLPWINHPEKGPYWWDGNHLAKMAPLPDWPTGWSCRVMRAHKNFLFALAITGPDFVAESQVSWSSSADPGLVPEFWHPAPENDAGDFTFSSPSGPVISGIGLRDQFFVMKERATFAAQYVGGQWIFQARDVFPSTGIFAPNAVLEHDNTIYMLTGDGELVRHDGNSVQNILYGVAQDRLIRRINAEYPSSVFLYFTDLTGVIAVAYPTETSKACTEAIGIEVASLEREGPPDIGTRDLPGVFSAARGFTEVVQQNWDSDPESWDSDTTFWGEQASGHRPAKVVFGGGANGLLELGLGTDVLGEPIAAFVERRGMDLGDFSVHKTISGAFPRVEGPDGDLLYYRFGGQAQAKTALEWGDELPYRLGVDAQLDFFQDGRLIAYSIRSDGGGQWTANGIQLMARKAGRW